MLLSVKRDAATTQKQSHRSRVVYLTGVALWSPIVIVVVVVVGVVVVVVVVAAGRKNLAKYALAAFHRDVDTHWQHVVVLFGLAY